MRQARSFIPALSVVLAAAILPGPAARGDDAAGGVRRDRIEADVRWLADDAREGRLAPSAGWAASRDHIAEAFAALDLEPLGDDGYVQAVTVEGDLITAPKEGANVVGVLRAPGGATEHVVIGAHFDHLGLDPETGDVMNGADDNASGTAVMLEVARVLSEPAVRRRLRRDVVFAAFDLEEHGLLGSQFYVDHAPIPIEQTTAMICLDMLGRSVMDATPGRLVALGTETSRDLDAAVREAAAASRSELWRLSTDYVGPRSDFVAFAEREVPHVFFTTVPHRDYHRPTDEADGVDFGSLTEHARVVAALTESLAIAETRTRWSGKNVDGLAEAKAIEAMTATLLERAASEDADEHRHRISGLQRLLLRLVHGHAKRLVENGEVGAIDRGLLVLGTFAVVLGVIDDDPLKTILGALRRRLGRQRPGR